MGLQLSSPYAGVRGQVPVIVRRHQQIPSAARAVESYGSDISLCLRELTISGGLTGPLPALHGGIPGEAMVIGWAV